MKSEVEYNEAELEEIERLVKNCCANYDSDYGCLPLDSDCYMLGIVFRESPLCKYFELSLMPESTILSKNPNRNTSDE